MGNSAYISTTCPECGNTLEVPMERGLDDLICPYCGKGGADSTEKHTHSPEDPAKEQCEEQDASLASLPVISKEHIPPEQAKKLFAEEVVHHFGYIDSRGGCSDASAAKQWILITNQRILFEAAVLTHPSGNINTLFVHQSGSIPVSKVSYVGTSTSQTPQGCSSTKVTNLRINSSGGEIVLAIPTQEEAARIQGVIDGIISQK